MNSEGLNENFRNDMIINDSSLKKYGIQARWVSNNNIMAFPTPCQESLNQPSHQPMLYDVKWNLDMNTSIGRKLVNESRLVFTSIQKLCKEVEDSPTLNEQLLKYSRNYRSILRSCFLELRLQAKEKDDEDEEVDKQTACQNHQAEVVIVKKGHNKHNSDRHDSLPTMHLYGMMELIWSLCEILFIEKLPDGMVLMHLMEWNKWHFPTADELVQECMGGDGDASPCDHPQYWDAIFALVLQGQITESRNLLKLHPSYQTQVYDAFSSVDELLRKMPTFLHKQGQSLSEFEMKWHYWHDECRKRLNDGDFDTKPELKVICKILCGDDDVIGGLKDLSGSWYQMLISYLFYKHPTISAYDMHYHAKDCISMCGGDAADFGALDRILLAAFKFDITQVIRECCDHLSCWFLPAHLADLLHHSDLLSSSESGGNLREYLLVEYASNLSNLDCYWQVVVDYLTHCGPQSDHFLPLFIQKIPLSSETKAAKVLRLCENRGFTDEAQSICRQMFRRAIQYDRLGTALSWAVRANDSSCAMHVANRMLDEYAKTGVFTNIDILDYLGPSILLSDRLTFLAKYRDFHKLYMDEEFEKAASLLFNLIVNAKAPMHFWPSLLTDCLPLLENEKLFYDVDATTKLLKCVNTLDQDSQIFDKLDEEMREKHSYTMKNLRLALIKNLAKAIVS